jgi:hypothetical protein
MTTGKSNHPPAGFQPDGITPFFSDVIIPDKLVNNQY